MENLTRQDTRSLRHFGLGLGLFILLAFWLLVPWLRGTERPGWPLLVAGPLMVAALAWPPAVLPVYRLFRPLARLIGFINTWLLLGAVFFGMLLPLGLALRVFGRLQYRTGLDPAAETYRIPVSSHHRVRLEDPF